MNSNGFVLKHNIICVESNSNTYSLFKLFIVILFLLQLRISPRKKDVLIDSLLVLVRTGTSLKVKKLYKEGMTRLMKQELKRKVKKMKRRLNRFYYLVVMMMRLLIHIHILHIYFQVLLLTVNVQRSSRILSFSLTAIICF